VALALSVGAAAAQEPLKIGLIQSMTGAFNTVGKAAVNGARLYVHSTATPSQGAKSSFIVKDDATSPEPQNGWRRNSSSMTSRDHRRRHHPVRADHRALGHRGKIPTVVMVSGASITVDRSPYMVRTSFTLGQSSAVIADWAPRTAPRKS